MATERFTFQGQLGQHLAARLDRPEGAILATALFAHCFTCGKDIAAARRIAGRLSAMGIAVLRFDFTGLGHSEGEFENTTFSSNVDDLIAAAGALTAKGLPPSLLIGHSLGGAAALRAAGQIDSVRAVTIIGTPFDPGHVTRNFDGALDRIARDGAAEVHLGQHTVRIGQDFVDDIAHAKLSDTIRDLGKALSRVANTVKEVESGAKAFAKMSDQVAALVSENRRPLARFMNTGLYEVSKFLTDGRQLIQSFTRLVRRIEKIETALEPDFQQLFVNAMALPNKVDPFPKLAAAVDLPPRKLPEAADADGGRRRRGGGRRGRG